MNQNSYIIVKSDAVQTRTIPAKGDRAAMHFREQKAAVETGEDFPQPFNISLEDDQRPYPPGAYQLCLSSVEVNQYGGLAMRRRVKLVPVEVAKPAAIASAK